jgi:hypothetical protein
MQVYRVTRVCYLLRKEGLYKAPEEVEVILLRVYKFPPTDTI